MADQDEVADKRTPLDIAKHWQEQIALAEKDHTDFVNNGKKVLDRYKGADKGLKVNRSKRLNILYSNTEVLRAALYGKSAKPDIRRRFGAEDKAATDVAEILEKALVYCAEAYDVDKPIELAVLDYLLPGRGVVRVEYTPTVKDDPETGQQFITDQKVTEEYVHWLDFLHMPARTWSDIQDNGWVSFRHRMSREDCIENFGAAIGKEVPLNWIPDLANKKDTPDSLKKAEVFEIWDITDRKRYWIVKGFTKPCRVDDDPYGLEQFFPVAEPPAFYVTTDTIVPEPEFHIYADQADDLDEIVARISRLTRALKRRGVYDQSVKELSRLANAGDNQFIPVENYQALATKGGLAAAFQTEDISVISAVLLQLYQQRDMLVQQIWEQMGIADIMRGSSSAQETLGAQQLKAQFGSQRLQRRQRAIQKWVRDLLKLKAEIIAEHFEPQVLQQMTGVPLVPQEGMPPEAIQHGQQIMEMLRTDKLRSYRIDIETDSTVFEDAQQERQSRTELVQAVTTFIQGWGPVVAAQPQMAPVAFELLKFGLGAFKATRGIDDAIEQASAQMEQQMQQQAANPKPDPEAEKAQAEMQLKQQEAQSKAQIAQMEAEQRLTLEKQKAEFEMQLKQQQFAQQLELDQRSAAREDEKAQYERQRAEQDQSAQESKFADELKYTHVEVEDVTGEELTQAIVRAVIPLTKNTTEGAAQAQAQMAAQQEQMGQMMAQMAQQMQQVMAAVAQSNQQIAQAVAQLAAPRRKIPIRDETGRITEAHDIPMSMN